MTQEAQRPEAPERQSRAFFAKLFDFSFEEFITISLIKVLYILSMIGAALVALAIFFAFVAQGGALIVVGIVVAPLAFLIYVVFARVWLETLIVVFRIADSARDIARNTRA